MPLIKESRRNQLQRTQNNSKKSEKSKKSSKVVKRIPKKYKNQNVNKEKLSNSSLNADKLWPQNSPIIVEEFYQHCSYETQRDLIDTDLKGEGNFEINSISF